MVLREQVLKSSTINLAKSLGFEDADCGRIIPVTDEERPQRIVGYTLSPTQSFMQKWLRDMHLIDVVSTPVRFTGHLEVAYWTYSVLGVFPIKNYRFNSYEDALEVGIKEGLETLKFKIK